MQITWPAGIDESVLRRLDFVVAADSLKTVLRRTILTDRSRQENSAEHSWHLALMALVLNDCAPRAIDLERALKILIVHDLVEIYAGDTYAYLDPGTMDTTQKEAAAARRLFGMLPERKGDQFLALWEEFEELATDEAKFCRALDRLQPILHNYCTEGQTWRENHVRPEQVRSIANEVERGSPRLGEMVRLIIDDAERRGFFQGGG